MIFVKSIAFLFIFGCATGIGGGESVLRKYEVPIYIYGDGN